MDRLNSGPASALSDPASAVRELAEQIMRATLGRIGADVSSRELSLDELLQGAQRPFREHTELKKADIDERGILQNWLSRFGIPTSYFGSQLNGLTAKAH